MNSDFKISIDQLNSAIVEKLIQILAVQKATSVTLIEMLAKDDAEADKFVSVLNERTAKNARDLYEELFVKRALIDPDDILPK